MVLFWLLLIVVPRISEVNGSIEEEDGIIKTRAHDKSRNMNIVYMDDERTTSRGPPPSSSPSSLWTSRGLATPMGSRFRNWTCEFHVRDIMYSPPESTWRDSKNSYECVFADGSRGDLTFEIEEDLLSDESRSIVEALGNETAAGGPIRYIQFAEADIEDADHGGGKIRVPPSRLSADVMDGSGIGGSEPRTKDQPQLRVVDHPARFIPKDHDDMDGRTRRRRQQQRTEEPRRRRSLKTQGESTVLVVKINARDKYFPNNAIRISDEELSARVFGSFGQYTDSVNLVSQYKACSFGKMIFKPANVQGATGGVISADVPLDTFNNDKSKLVNAALPIVLQKTGLPIYASLETVADHVMYCVPEGTGSWFAYAYMNWFVSVYNGLACTYVSAQMHEIGHNIGLGHAGKLRDRYADTSGYMGYGFLHHDWPAMCFNGAKSWRLGWYSDRHALVNPNNNEEWVGALVGVADYGNSNIDHTVVARVTLNDGVNVFVSFNRKKGINDGTYTTGDKVNIVHGEEESSLLASLAPAQEFQIGGKIVHVCGIQNEGVDYARVSIRGEDSPLSCDLPRQQSPASSPSITILGTPAPVADNSPAPSTSPSLSPTTQPSMSPFMPTTGNQLPDPMVAFHFDENAKGEGTHGIDGLVVGDPKYRWDERGFFLEFDQHERQYVTLGQHTWLDFGVSTAFTVSVWVKSEPNSNYDAAIISNKDWYEVRSKGWVIATSFGQWQWNIADGVNQHQYYGETGQIDDGKWHNIVVSHSRIVFDATARLYFDGSIVAEVDISDVGDITSGLPTVIGTDGTYGNRWPAWFQGSLDSIVMYSDALSPSDVKMLYQAGRTSTMGSAVKEQPSASPSSASTITQTMAPSISPTFQPASTPSATPSLRPSASPNNFNSVPSKFTKGGTPSPSLLQSGSPTDMFDPVPTKFNKGGTANPSSRLPLMYPTAGPSETPSRAPTSQPSQPPTQTTKPKTTKAPTIPRPTTSIPSKGPSDMPSLSMAPSLSLTPSLSRMPSSMPSTSFEPSNAPSFLETTHPSPIPSSTPTEGPSSGGRFRIRIGKENIFVHEEDER